MPMCFRGGRHKKNGKHEYTNHRKLQRRTEPRVAVPYTRTETARNYAIKLVLLKLRERRVVEAGTENAGRGEDQLRLLKGDWRR